MATPRTPPEPVRGPLTPQADSRLAERDDHVEPRRYETRDVNIRAILWLAIATTLGAAIVQVGLYFLLQSYDAQARRNDPQLSPLTESKAAPPGPRLQSTPLADYEQYQQEQQRLTSTYGWVDRQQGVVRIPVERAMELYLQHRQPPVEPAATAPSPSTETQP